VQDRSFRTVQGVPGLKRSTTAFRDGLVKTYVTRCAPPHIRRGTCERGNNYRGIWGLHGSFDYISPQSYQISSTALSLGTTAQWWFSRTVALQGTALAGLGYAAVGALHGGSESDYHYGVTSQALLRLRLMLGDTAALDLKGYEYRVPRAGSDGRHNIARTDLSFTLRVYKHHALTVKFLWNRRDASFPFLGDTIQARSTVGVFYTYLSDDRFGAIDWR